jgi:hypothetical protein
MGPMAYIRSGTERALRFLLLVLELYWIGRSSATSSLLIEMIKWWRINCFLIERNRASCELFLLSICTYGILPTQAFVLLLHPSQETLVVGENKYKWFVRNITSWAMRMGHILPWNKVNSKRSATCLRTQTEGFTFCSVFYIILYSRITFCEWFGWRSVKPRVPSFFGSWMYIFNYN